jgi:hypothetical protein
MRRALASGRTRFSSPPPTLPSASHQKTEGSGRGGPFPNAELALDGTGAAAFRLPLPPSIPVMRLARAQSEESESESGAT